MVNKYLPMDANTLEEAIQYYRVRAQEVGMNLDYVMEDHDNVFIAHFKDKQGETNYSVYIPEHLRGKGLIKNYTHFKPIITMEDCAVENVLSRFNFEYKVHEGWCDFQQYSFIKHFYKDKKANRSGEFLMWHITRGCNIMHSNGASDSAIKAYMLHPIFQGDSEFKDNWKKLYHYCEGDSVIMRNVIEYRKSANAYLCKPYTDSWGEDEIKEAAPILFEDVRQMLLADKIQNKEDFIKHHIDTHKRSKELLTYFNNWIEYLESLGNIEEK